MSSRLAALLPGYPDVSILVAFSGGVDSTALLAALAGIGTREPRVRAVHVDHGIHPNAPRWSEHCRIIGRQLGIPVRILRRKVVRAAGESLEAAARDSRYAALAELLAPGEFLLTAHHEDDQLETVLLQLFRGAGLAGLAAMPAIAPFSRGSHARPLLARTRGELLEWVRSRNLTWIEDDTNADETLDRNYLRRRVLPAIRERWSGVAGAVSRSARHAAEGQALLDLMGRTDVERASSGVHLFVPTLRALQPDRRRNALRYWIARRGFRLPDTARLEELAGPVLAARRDSNPRVAWSGVEVRRHADLLSIGPCSESSNASQLARAVEWEWRKEPMLRLPDPGGTLELKSDPHGPIDLDTLPETFTVRSRMGGERLRPHRGGPRRSLKRLLQESHLPLARRPRIPLLFSGATLLAVGGLWVDASIQVSAATVHRARLVHSEPAPE